MSNCSPINQLISPPRDGRIYGPPFPSKHQHKIEKRMKNVDPYNARYYEAHPTLPSLPPAHCKPRAYRQVHLTKTPRPASLRHMWTVQTWYAPRSHAFCLVFFWGGAGPCSKHSHGRFVSMLFNASGLGGSPFQERAPVKPLNPGAKKTSFESLFAETVVFKISLTFGPQNPEKCRC